MPFSVPNILNELKRMTNDKKVSDDLRLKAQVLRNDLLETIASEKKAIDLNKLTQFIDNQGGSQ